MNSPGWGPLTERLAADLHDVVVMHGRAEAAAILSLRCVIHRAAGTTRTALEEAALQTMRECIARLDLSRDAADRDAMALLFGLAPGTRELPAEARYERIVERYRAWNASTEVEHGRKPESAVTIRQKKRPLWVELMADALTEMERREVGDELLEGVVSATSREERQTLTVTWPMFDTMAAQLALDLRSFRPDLIVGIARGGLTLAVTLSHHLGVRRMGVATIHKYVDDAPFAPAGRVELESLLLPDGLFRRVVLVDDIVSVGDTMITAAAHVRQALGAEVSIAHAALIADVARLRRHRPALLHAEHGFLYALGGDNEAMWVAFPWELGAVPGGPGQVVPSADHGAHGRLRTTANTTAAATRPTPNQRRRNG